MLLVREQADEEEYQGKEAEEEVEEEGVEEGGNGR